VTVAAEATSSPKARTAWEARIVPSRVAKCRANTAVTVETMILRSGGPTVFELTDPNEIYYFRLPSHTISRSRKYRKSHVSSSTDNNE
jgi:hypothetical protein